jgi:hypothetical protein
MFCEPAALPSSGKCCNHQFMTRSLLEKKRWAAEVDAISLVVDSSRNASHVRTFSQDYRDDVGTAEQFVGGGQAGGAGPDNGGLFLHARKITVTVN